MISAKGKSQAELFFLKRYKVLYIWLLVVTIGYTVLESISISIFFPLIGSVVGTAGSNSKIFKFLDVVISYMPFKDRFINVIVLVVVVFFVKESLGFVKHSLTGYGMGKVITDVKEEIFEKYVDSDYQFFLDNKQGKLTYDLLSATGRLGNFLQLLPDIITAGLMTLTIGVLLFSISFKVTLFLLAVGLGYNLITQILAKKVSYHIGNERVLVGTKANVIANEFIDGIKHIKVFGSFGFWRKGFIEAVRRFKKLLIEDYIWIGVPERVMQLLLVAILIGVALFMKRLNQVSPEALSTNVALVGVYLYAFYRLVPFLTSFGKLRMQLMGILPDVEIVYNALNQRTKYIEDGEVEIKNFEKEIKFEGMTFSYKGKGKILEDVSFSVKKGETTAIVGISGSGKTTLINLLGRLFICDSGRITIDGIDIRDIKYSSLTHLTGLVSQDTFIFNATIKENILFGLKDVLDERLFDAAKLANARDFIMHFPEGYETVVGDKGLKLSGGQRQRIAIARAILRDPQILILDEATSSLDYHSEAVVQKAINEVSKNRTVIIIAHRLSTVINADKIIVLAHGRVAEEGTHGDLMRKNGTYRALYDSQSRSQYEEAYEES